MKRDMAMFIVIGLFAMVIAVNGYAAEGVIKATASWVAVGRYYQVKAKQALFVGALEGRMFLESKQGDLDEAKIVCPGMIEINLDSGAQSGQGRCIITTHSEDHVYASWNCAGEYTQGCAGDFQLLGGTGKLEKITGNSKFKIRSDMVTSAVAPEGGSLEGTASGIAVWPALTYRIP